ncbi:MAG: hypothetical protein R6U85_05125 [Salinivirgaceae bacterium]
MQRLLFIFTLLIGISIQSATGQNIQEQLSDYRFEVRIKGPSHKRGKLLEVKVDKHNNYLAMTFAASSYRYIHLYIYRLYTWKPVQELRIEAKRIELYNSTFDVDGNYLYANTNVYKNEFLKIDLKTGKQEPVACNQVPGNGCKPLEVRQYETTAKTVGENYIIFQDPKFDNYVRIFVRKELYKIQNEDQGGVPDFLMEKKEDVIQKISTSHYTIKVDEQQFKELKDYGYLKAKKFDIIVNDELSKTFEFDKLTTSTIVMPKSAIETIENEGEWIKGELRIKGPQ